MEPVTVMPNALKPPLSRDRLTQKFGGTMQLAAHNLISGRPTNKQASTQLIPVKLQDTTDAKEQIAVSMIRDIKEFVIRMDVA